MKSPDGKVKGIYLGSRKGEAKSLVESAELIAGHGLKGDSHAGRDPDRQVSLFSIEVLRQMESEGFQVSAEDLSTNFLTEDISLDSLKPGERLRVGETVIEIVEARRPCRNITKIDNRLPKRLYGRCGLLGLIVKGGVVRTGDDIEVLASDRQPVLF
jgi:MOSC domain-containing protein YiiM